MKRKLAYWNRLFRKMYEVTKPYVTLQVMMEEGQAQALNQMLARWNLTFYRHQLIDSELMT